MSEILAIEKPDHFFEKILPIFSKIQFNINS